MVKKFDDFEINWIDDFRLISDYFVNFQDEEKIVYSIGTWSSSDFNRRVCLVLKQSKEIDNFYENPHDSDFLDRLQYLGRLLLNGHKLMIRIEISLSNRRYKMGSPTTYHDDTYVSYFESDLDILSGVLKNIYKLRDAVSDNGYKVGVGFNKEKVIVDLVTIKYS